AADSSAGANTAARIPENEGLEQHVEGTKRESRPDKAGVVPDTGAERQKVVAINRGARVAAEPAASELPVAPASPSVRRLARELGVNIDQVQGTGLEGRISIDDVKAHAKRLLAGGGGGAAAPAGEPLPDFSRWGDID